MKQAKKSTDPKKTARAAVRKLGRTLEELGLFSEFSEQLNRIDVSVQHASVPPQRFPKTDALLDAIHHIVFELEWIDVHDGNFVSLFDNHEWDDRYTQMVKNFIWALNLRLAKYHKELNESQPPQPPAARPRVEE